MDENIARLRKGYFLQGKNGYLVICIHGFDGSPAEHYLAALAFNQAGYAVSVPLLKGHGTCLADMDKAKWPQWVQSVEEEYQLRRGYYRGVYLFGLSMGGLLALYMGEHHPEIKALGLCAPAVLYKSRSNYLAFAMLPFKKHLPFQGRPFNLPKGNELYLTGGYEANSVHGAMEMNKLQLNVRRHLNKMERPFIIFQSVPDTLVNPATEKYVLRKTGTSKRNKTGVLYPDGCHVMTLDLHCDEIFAKTLAFFIAHP